MIPTFGKIEPLEQELSYLNYGELNWELQNKSSTIFYDKAFVQTDGEQLNKQVLFIEDDEDEDMDVFEKLDVHPGGSLR